MQSCRPYEKAKPVFANFDLTRHRRRRWPKTFAGGDLWICGGDDFCAWKISCQSGENPFAQTPHAGGVKLRDQGIGKTIHNQPGKSIAFGMNHSPGVADFIKPQDIAPKGRRLSDAAEKPFLIYRLFGIIAQHP